MLPLLHGPKAEPILLEGLQTLEYRGYDSAGIAMPGMVAVRTPGAVDELRKKMNLGKSDAKSGIAHLRGHETDRLSALRTEFNNLGGDVTETDDGLVINPRPLHGGEFLTYEDHRMATAGAIIGLRVPDVLVANVETTAKTLPDFPQRWTAMLSGSDA